MIDSSTISSSAQRRRQRDAKSRGVEKSAWPQHFFRRLRPKWFRAGEHRHKSGTNTFPRSGSAFYTNNNLQARNNFEKQP